MDSRVKLLFLALVIMLFNSIYQYSWNSISLLVSRTLNSSVTAIEVAFTLYAILSSFSQIGGGYIIDTIGPRLVGVISAIFFSLGFLIPVIFPNIILFYISWSLGSIAEGILYGIAVNVALKWYENKRGFATGIVSLGFGIGGAIFNPFISIYRYYYDPFIIIGILSLFCLLLISFNVTYPPRDKLKGNSPKKIIRGKDWWLIYFSYSFAIIPLLSFSSSLSFLGSELPRWLLLLSITIFPVTSGLGRPLFGMLSDKMNRFHSVIILNSLTLLASLLSLLSLPLSAILVGLFGGSTLTLYLSLLGDIYGNKFSGTNTGILYTGKAFAGTLGSILLGYFITISKSIALLFIIVSPLISIILLLAASKVLSY
ncbi:oxalate/formate antiport family MFS transporter [Sulfolobus sp. B1]|uniref:MFS transporter n=1 Tax=Sulfolobaceae TaxID=118883 RepID=UPI00117D2603|nr:MULTISPECIES: MFS transporter [unclassified Sulfolobus]TRM87459.1 oxalate/formate antiport family MFS transporter [Sulfolobus sp. C3]TRM94825.1 oxalate/formate antiport family MFS transporter [Sulfolobus sp. B1]TRN02231.1 oxalate/formate antiport family MFS transporter [Sulfolobus sp. F1]TRN04095.1 oxalate/formate antiport family MFS transporter [Sulfolobus sp. E1]